MGISVPRNKDHTAINYLVNIHTINLYHVEDTVKDLCIIF